MKQLSVVFYNSMSNLQNLSTPSCFMIILLFVGHVYTVTCVHSLVLYARLLFFCHILFSCIVIFISTMVGS